jgi:adsorption protein B
MGGIFSFIDFWVREFSFFAAFWLCLGAIDDIFVDFLWLRFLSGKSKKPQYMPSSKEFRANYYTQNKPSRFAVMIPVWQESAVILNTLQNITNIWDCSMLRIYVGCYPNDAETIRAVMQAGTDPRVRIVLNPLNGPTTKAQCLNRLWQAMRDDEMLYDADFDAIILHDAEDMVHPDALQVFADHLRSHQTVQLPVLPMPYPGSAFISGHYCDEFAEAHGKFMPVRQMLGASLPLAGVGCAIDRQCLENLVQRQDSGLSGPFSEQSLTEDYELGIRLHNAGAKGYFATQYAADGELIATRAYFPHDLSAAVRQKSRWTAGIALSGWDRLGWQGQVAQSRKNYSHWAEYWMRIRDRRSMLGAVVLLAAYMALAGGLILSLAQNAGWYDIAPYSSPLITLLIINAAFLLWRLALRCYFTYRYYGVFQAILAVPRMMISNIISIMAARRAVFSYCRLLAGRPVFWDKTRHMLPTPEDDKGFAIQNLRWSLWR